MKKNYYTLLVQIAPKNFTHRIAKKVGKHPHTIRQVLKGRVGEISDLTINAVYQAAAKELEGIQEQSNSLVLDLRRA